MATRTDPTAVPGYLNFTVPVHTDAVVRRTSAYFYSCTIKILVVLNLVVIAVRNV